MDQTIEDKKEDAAAKLIERGFFVEHPSRPITLDTVPMDGSEFIHRSRLEDAQLSYCVDLNVNNASNSKSVTRPMKRWGRKQAQEFTNLVTELKLNKRFMIKKFPSKIETPNAQDDVEWCVFCLGTKMCSKIYGEDLSQKRQGHLPTLSIVIHLNQEQIMMLITYFYDWVQEVGINDNIGRWVYALFAVLEKPVDEIFQKQLEAFHDLCKKIFQSLDDEKYKHRVYLIMSILHHHFCVKSHAVGLDIDGFIQMFKH